MKKTILVAPRFKIKKENLNFVSDNSKNTKKEDGYRPRGETFRSPRGPTHSILKNSLCAPAPAHEHVCAYTREEILIFSEKLEKNDKKWLLDQLSLSIQTNSKNTENRDLSMWATAMHDRLFKSLAVQNYGQALVRKVLSERANWEPVMQFMQSSGFFKLSVADRQAAYILLANLTVLETIRVCQHRGLPPSLKIFASNAQNVAAHFEAAFPGYIAAGIAIIVVRKKFEVL